MKEKKVKRRLVYLGACVCVSFMSSTKSFLARVSQNGRKLILLLFRVSLLIAQNCIFPAGKKSSLENRALHSAKLTVLIMANRGQTTWRFCAQAGETSSIWSREPAAGLQKAEQFMASFTARWRDYIFPINQFFNLNKYSLKWRRKGAVISDPSLTWWTDDSFLLLRVTNK